MFFITQSEASYSSAMSYLLEVSYYAHFSPKRRGLGTDLLNGGMSESLWTTLKSQHKASYL